MKASLADSGMSVYAVGKMRGPGPHVGTAQCHTATLWFLDTSSEAKQGLGKPAL